MFPLLRHPSAAAAVSRRAAIRAPPDAKPEAARPRRRAQQYPAQGFFVDSMLPTPAQLVVILDRGRGAGARLGEYLFAEDRLDID
eukprot:1861573-Alexandrium_andersonii.AAC.1